MSIHLADEPTLRATFFEVVDQNGLRAVVPTRLTSGRGDVPVAQFVEGDVGEDDDVWSHALQGRERYESDVKKHPLRSMDVSRPR
ncbi:hypothetical protein [Leucobacter aridicollis]|uniref:hypothetical protein n=1 Tax=Leucobacter aridicollis TaxID=283878 RepID=UPI0037C56C08